MLYLPLIKAHFIEETILSIINQKYPNLELIIIDGLSTDNTLEIVKKYFDSINYFVSEKDNGQAHALNKGFQVASGEICSYLNSDDIYIDNILWKIAEEYLKINLNGFILMFYLVIQLKIVNILKEEFHHLKSFVLFKLLLNKVFLGK